MTEKKMPTKRSERRRFPRKEAQVKVRLAATRDQSLVFEAHLPSRDVSIGGIFLESEFFVKGGTELDVVFEVPEVSEPIRLRGMVIREQRVEPQGRGMRSGFAIQFTEYFSDAKFSLAAYFLAPEVRSFIRAYRRTGRQNRIRGEEERMADLILAWEMDRLEEGRERIAT